MSLLKTSIQSVYRDNPDKIKNPNSNKLYLNAIKGGNPMESLYNDILHFMEEYFPAYSRYAQDPETQHLMDRFYTPDLTFDEGVVTSREQWYERCLTHPGVQDKLTVEHLFIDERQKEAGALLKTQAVDRKTGEVLLELKMNVLYNLKIEDKDIKITRVRVYLESNPDKVRKLAQLYAIAP